MVGSGTMKPTPLCTDPTPTSPPTHAHNPTAHHAMRSSLHLHTLLLIVATAAAPPTVLGDRQVAWQELSCPAAGAPFGSACTHRNTGSSDAAITFFFQTESVTAAGGGFTCTDTATGVPLCARQWTTAEQGSAGTCFFLLRAGASYSCSGTGTVNVIGAHAVALNGTVVDPAPAHPTPLGCPTAAGSAGCSYTASTTADEWAHLSFSSPDAKHNALSCTLETGKTVVVGEGDGEKENTRERQMGSREGEGEEEGAPPPPLPFTTLVANKYRDANCQIPIKNSTNPLGKCLPSSSPTSWVVYSCR